jgi:phosphopantothenoylcysteine decarboxylase/phosphopantothenate--cysteine ligase
LISGPVSMSTIHKNIKLIKVTTAREMQESCMANAKNYDLAFMAAAVADYSPEVVSDEKIKKKEGTLTMTLKKTDDILANLGKVKTNGQVLVGFALETNNEEENAKKKLKDKNADAIILNSMNDAGAAFGYDTNKVTIYYKNGQIKKMGLKSKAALSKDIIDAINELM